MSKLFGWTEHAIVGAVATCIGIWILQTHTQCNYSTVLLPDKYALANFAYILFGAVLHELGDGDLITASDAPWNGIKDVAAFMVVPLLLLAYDLLR